MVLSSSSDARVAAALDWLSARRDHRRLVVVGATQEAADGLVRRLQARSGASLFGWTRTTLPRLAAQVAARYDKLYAMNDPSKGGSFYLQSKILRAREALDAEIAAGGAKT